MFTVLACICPSVNVLVTRANPISSLSSLKYNKSSSLIRLKKHLVFSGKSFFLENEFLWPFCWGIMSTQPFEVYMQVACYYVHPCAGYCAGCAGILHVYQFTINGIINCILPICLDKLFKSLAHLALKMHTHTKKRFWKILMGKPMSFSAQKNKSLLFFFFHVIFWSMCFFISVFEEK